jgi:hypothetical protein
MSTWLKKRARGIKCIIFQINLKMYNYPKKHNKIQSGISNGFFKSSPDRISRSMTLRGQSHDFFLRAMTLQGQGR